jgi:hypothetical protein
MPLSESLAAENQKTGLTIKNALNGLNSYLLAAFVL